MSKITLIRKAKGFTLIEIVIVMVILGILAIVAIPKFVDLTTDAKIAATKATLGSVRSVLAVTYASNAAAGNAAFPTTDLTVGDFADGKLPVNKLTGNDGAKAVAAAPAGTATDAADGFWFVTTTGVAGAYSDGTEDTSTW
ncbi:MAG: type II secretion system protein [Candidatus Omnitrophota bacterium]